MGKKALKKKVLILTDLFLETKLEDLENLLEDLAENGSDSDHGLDGDSLAKDIVRAAIDLR